jgi:hypothetical protein
MALDGPGEAAALRCADDVDDVAGREDVRDRQLLADAEVVDRLDAELAQGLRPRQVLELAGDGLGELPGLTRA